MVKTKTIEYIHSFIPTFTHVDTGKNLGGKNEKLHSNRLFLIGEGIQAALECSESILPSSQRMLRFRASSLNYELSWYKTNRKENQTKPRHGIAGEHERPRWWRHELHTQIQCWWYKLYKGKKSLAKKHEASQWEVSLGQPSSWYTSPTDTGQESPGEEPNQVSHFGEVCPKPQRSHSLGDNLI